MLNYIVNLNSTPILMPFPKTVEWLNYIGNYTKEVLKLKNINRSMYIKRLDELLTLHKVELMYSNYFDEQMTIQDQIEALQNEIEKCKKEVNNNAIKSARQIRRQFIADYSYIENRLINTGNI